MFGIFTTNLIRHVPIIHLIFSTKLKTFDIQLTMQLS